MEYVSAIGEKGSIDKESLERFLTTMAPFAPFITEQLWSEIGNEFSIHQQSWPEIKSQVVEQAADGIPFQINGKLRSVVAVDQQFAGTMDDILNLIAADPKLAGKLTSETIKNIIYKPGKVINIVI